MQKTILSGAGSSAIFSPGYTVTRQAKTGILKKFFAWCANQEDNRFLWLAISFFGLIGMALPITAMAILFAGGNREILWIIACAVNVPILVLNLAAQPPKIILPVLCFAVIADICVIATSVAMLFSK